MGKGTIRVTFNNFDRIADRFPRAVHDGLFKGATETVRVARPLTPFRTGHLSVSPQIKDGPRRVVVFWPAPYAIYQEEGRGPIQAKPGKFLVFKGKDGKTVFAKKVGPAAGHHFAKRGAEVGKRAATAYLEGLESQL